MRRLILVLVAAVVVVLASVAAPRPAAASEPSFAPPGKVKWRDGVWPRFSAWEAAGAVSATAAAFVLERAIADPTKARIRFEVPVIDPTVRFLLRGRTKRMQDTFGVYSDIGFRMMAFFPYVVDDGVAALGAHLNPDVAAQLFLIDLQALTLSGATQLAVSRVLARERPYVQDCDAEGKTFTRTCGDSNDFKSFYSGHTAGVFTSAGLVCVHHQHLPLFGGGPVEAWACAWAVGVAAFTGIGRIISDNHYFTDVLVGAGIGTFYGYIMPRLLHFRAGPIMERAHRAGFDFLPSFTPTADGGGVLSASGLF